MSQTTPCLHGSHGDVHLPCLPDDVWHLIWHHVYEDCIGEMQQLSLAMMQSREPRNLLSVNHGNVTCDGYQFYSLFDLGVFPVKSSEGMHEYLNGIALQKKLQTKNIQSTSM